VFWSGYKFGALEDAKALGITLEKTPGGRLMSWLEHDAKVWTFSTRTWDWASATFARNAKGTAIAVIRAPGRVWTTIESKILESRGIPVRHVP
jgi:hypothetical protein